MKIFLAGVSCVGKTAIGKCLAEKLRLAFYDLDLEIEKFFAEPIGRLQARFLTDYTFREETAAVIKRLVETNKNNEYVVALRPSGLMDSYYRILKNLQCTIIALTDAPENILSRITFYDEESKPLVRKLSEKEKAHYLREIRADMSYFGRTYKRAHLTIDIAGLGIEESARKIMDILPKNC
jgi:shikimate kinase